MKQQIFCAGFWRRFFLSMAIFLMSSVIVGPVLAQGIIIDSPPVIAPPPSQPAPITIDVHDVTAVIDGPVANVHVAQVFRNETRRTVEGVYIFPLPAEAAVSDFQLTVDGAVLEGKLLDKDEARRIYEEIVRSRRDPALLEYLGRNLFQTSVFPIPAGASRKLELSYTQVVSPRDGITAFVYPLRTQHYSAKPVKSLSLSIELRNQPGLRTIYSPNFDIAVERLGDDRAIVGYEATNVQPEQDFSLYFGTDANAVGLNVLSYKPAGKDGFFLLLAAPTVEVAASQVVARDLILVVDTSGSMQGEKIEQARQAAHFVVDNLNAGDRYNLIGFSTGVHLWQNELQPTGKATQAAAHDWIDQLAATGSTDINRALLEALGQLDQRNSSARPAYILFLTDGMPTMGETDPGRILDNADKNQPAQRVRLFTFGVGYDVNTDLLDALSRAMGGRSSYVKPDEAIDERVSEFYQGISTPVLVDLSLDLGRQIVADEIYPYPLPDLFAGDQLVIVGRYRSGGSLTVTLRGTANGEKITYQYPGRELVGSGGEPFVARLWATRKVGALLDQIRRSGPLQELVDEVVDLSLKYGIVTPYTSYLVVEPEGSDVSATPVPLRERAEAEVAMSADQAAAAPASGEKAVAASEARSALYDAETVAESRGVRYVNGKTFVAQTIQPAGKPVQQWVDTLYDPAMPTETLRFASDRYFELAEQAELSAWFALGPEVVIVVGDGQALRITAVD